jgi:hypothetical protein
MLPLELAFKRLMLAHGQDLCSPIHSSTSGGACLGSDPCAGLFIRTVKIAQGILVVMFILQSSAGASSSSSLVRSPGQESANDYPEIGSSTC